MKEFYTTQGWANTNYRLDTEEFAAFLCWLVKNHQSTMISLYTDDPPDSPRTGGHIFEGVYPCSLSYGNSSDVRFNARPRDEHWSASDDIKRIRRVDIGRIRYWHVNNDWVASQARLPLGAEREFFKDMQEFLIKREAV